MVFRHDDRRKDRTYDQGRHGEEYKCPWGGHFGLCRGRSPRAIGNLNHVYTTYPPDWQEFPRLLGEPIATSAGRAGLRYGSGTQTAGPAGWQVFPRRNERRACAAGHAAGCQWASGSSPVTCGATRHRRRDALHHDERAPTPATTVTRGTIVGACVADGLPLALLGIGDHGEQRTWRCCHNGRPRCPPRDRPHVPHGGQTASHHWQRSRATK